MIRTWLCCTAVCLLTTPGLLRATGDYPVDTVTLVTHSSPGSGSDIFLRQIAPFLSSELGVDIVVRNIRGGSGVRAMVHLAKSPPDGSTFYATTPTFILTSLLSEPEVRYTDIEPLLNIFVDPEVIYTAASSPYTTLDAVFASARQQRGRWGAANPASPDRLALERLKTSANVNASIVTHDGGGELLINVLNGALQIGIGEVQELQGQLQAGRVRLLATFNSERMDAFPDLPTVRELGYDIVVRKFRGLAGPRGIPDEIVTRWETAVQSVLRDEDYQAIYRANKLEPLFIPRDQYGPFIETFAAEVRMDLRNAGIID